MTVGTDAAGDLGLIVERASGSLQLVNVDARKSLQRITGLGDLSHASIKFSRNEQRAYVFGRDGGLTQVDLTAGRIINRRMQAGNSIGGAISRDGRLVAVANYEPGGVNVFTADGLEPVTEIPAVGESGERSKVVGLVDAPGQRFVFSLYDAGEIWVADFSSGDDPQITRFRDIGRQPYDALITPDGRFYIAGLFGEDGLVLLDLENPESGPRRILDHYGRSEKPLPVYKMPHLEGWAVAGDHAFLPAVGRHELLVVDTRDWEETRRIPLAGQPVFAVARPDGRQVWVNFAPPHNDRIQVIDVAGMKVVKELRPGKGVLHMEFSPNGEAVWVSVRDEDRVDVYNTERLKRIARIEAATPSGIFFAARAHRIGL
ncbi:MAG: cytochrome D1 domain-containing protein [Gammaproteobacteria bacterium]|nr:cytochrome D1 domain-containing protein [Gammaproteobacteria bacterium]